MRKKIFILLIGIFLLTSKASALNIATVKDVNISVDGNVQSVSCYNINGYNYFKLRDVAKLMMGTQKGFDIELTQDGFPIAALGKTYTANGDELSPLNTKSLKVTPKFQSLSFMNKEGTNSSTYVVKSYNIANYNYMSLRDIAKAANFSLGYDEVNKTINIDSSNNYVYQSKPRAEKIDTMIDYVYSVLGAPYSAVDCSGLVSSAIQVAGFDVPAEMLYSWTIEAYPEYFVEIPMNQLQKGDILNKSGQHMMLYIGNGMVAESIETTGVRITKLRTKGYKAYRITE